MLVTSANKSIEKKKIENVIKQLVRMSAVRSSRYEAKKKIENVIKQLVRMSAVRSSRYEALGKFEGHSRS